MKSLYQGIKKYKLREKRDDNGKRPVDLLDNKDYNLTDEFRFFLSPSEW